MEGEIEKLAIGIGDAGDMMSRLSETRNVDEVESLISNLHVTSENLRKASQELEDILISSRGLVEASEKIVKSNEYALQNTIEDAEFTMQSLATSIHSVLANLERAAQEIAALAGKINDDPSIILTGQESERDPLR